jgi:hypothetical protein
MMSFESLHALAADGVRAFVCTKCLEELSPMTTLSKLSNPIRLPETSGGPACQR